MISQDLPNQLITKTDLNGGINYTGIIHDLTHLSFLCLHC